MGQNCSACHIKINKDKDKKGRTICKTCYNKKKRMKVSVSEKQKNQSLKIATKRKKTVLFFSAHITQVNFYLMLNKFKKIRNKREIVIKT